jgi:uncharacterized protein YybS (DUF2232 family)
MLNPVFYRYKKELCKWVPVIYLLVYSICTPLLYMRKLGPFNPSEPVNYQRTLLINFLIAALV